MNGVPGGGGGARVFSALCGVVLQACRLDLVFVCCVGGFSSVDQKQPKCLSIRAVRPLLSSLSVVRALRDDLA